MVFQPRMPFQPLPSPPASESEPIPPKIGSRYFVTELLGTDPNRLLTSRPLKKQFIQYLLYQIPVRWRVSSSPQASTGHLSCDEGEGHSIIVLGEMIARRGLLPSRALPPMTVQLRPNRATPGPWNIRLEGRGGHRHQSSHKNHQYKP